MYVYLDMRSTEICGRCVWDMHLSYKSCYFHLCVWLSYTPLFSFSQWYWKSRMRHVFVLEIYETCICHRQNNKKIYPKRFIQDITKDALKMSKQVYSDLWQMPVSCGVTTTRVMQYGWLRLVGSLTLWVSFADYSLFYRALLQKRLMSLPSGCWLWIPIGW